MNKLILWFLTGMILSCPALSGQTGDLLTAWEEKIGEAASQREAGNVLMARNLLKEIYPGHEDIRSQSQDLFQRLSLEWGRILNALDRYESAKEVLMKGLSSVTETQGPESVLAAEFKVSIGDAEKRLHRLEEARDYYQDALKIMQDELLPNDKRTASLLLKMAHSYVWTANNQKTLLYLGQAKALIDRHHTRDPKLLVGLYNGFGNLYNNMRDSARSISNYLRALEISEAAGEENKGLSANIYLNIGIHYFDYKNFLAARKSWENSLRIQEKIYGKDHASLAQIICWIGETYDNVGLYVEALDHFQRALAQQFQDYNPENLFANPVLGPFDDFNTGTYTLQAKGEALQKLSKKPEGEMKHLVMAEKCFSQVIDAIDSVRYRLTGDESRSYITWKVMPSIENGLKICKELWETSGETKWLEKAFWYMERSKSASMLEALASEKAIIQFGAERMELVNRERKLRKEMGDLQKELFLWESGSGQKDEQSIRAAREQLYDLRRTYRALIRQIREDFPEYFDLKFEQEIIPMGQVQERLQKDQILLEYFSNDTVSFVLGISRDTVILHYLPHGRWIVDEIQAFTSLHSPDHASNPESHRKWALRSMELYQEFIAPFPQTFLQDKHLIIAPSGPLNYLPFELLISEWDSTSAKVNFRNLPYLLRDHQISYTNSATLLFGFMDLERVPAKGKLLAFAPSFSGGTSADREGISNLKHNAGEADRIARIMKGRVFTGVEATESRFKADAGNYRVIHLATHGLVDDEDPLYSKVAFAGDSLTGEDGFLHLYELFSLELQADLAVLSACNTGEGTFLTGEGIMSLARGFLFAGCPSIVMTLWEVDDFATSEIMDDFYQHLASGDSKPAALRQAKLNYLENAAPGRDHPFFWAGFIQFGDPTPLEQNRPIWIWIGIGLLAIGMILLARKQFF